MTHEVYLDSGRNVRLLHKWFGDVGLDYTWNVRIQETGMKTQRNDGSIVNVCETNIAFDHPTRLLF